MDSSVQPVLFRYPARVPGPVALVGSFNNWNPRTHLLRRVDRGWRIIVYLPPGTYPYAFVTNGQLVRDPDSRRSSVSARYSVLTVGGRQSGRPGRQTSVTSQRRVPVMGALSRRQMSQPHGDR